jgi:hypothetical protein
MSTIAGLRGTGDWATDERPKNFREYILWNNPNGSAPLTALLSKMGSESCDDPEFNWWEESEGLIRISVNDATDDGTHTTLTVDATGGGPTSDSTGALSVVKGDILMVENGTGTGELVQVSADPTTDTSLALTRGVAGTTAATIADNSFLLKVGSAFAEGTGAPTATTKNPSKKTNLMQIFKTVYDMTNTAAATKTRTGDPMKNDKKRKTFAHSRDMELAFWFGHQHEAVGANGKPLRYTGGLNSFITTNRTAFSGQGSAANQWGIENLINAFAAMFNDDGDGAGNERLGFCGNGYLNALNLLIETNNSTQIQYAGTIKVWGLELTKLIIPQGTIYFKTHPLFNKHPVYTKAGFFINPKGLIYRYLKGRDTHFKDNIQANDADEQKGQWLSECGLEVHFESTMCAMFNAGG